MANKNRLNSVWAENAVTNIPDVPVTGTAYRDEQYNDNYADGQQYDAIYNSARYNQFFYQISSLLKEVCEQGMLRWVEGQHYVNNAVVFYNSNVYIALREILADEQPYPEPGKSTAWLKLVWQAGKGLTTDYLNEQIQFNAGAGLSIDSNNNVNVNVGKGMTIVDDTIMPLVGQGIGLDENGRIIPKLGSSLRFNQDGSIEVANLISEGEGISADPDTGKVSVNVGAGLEIDGANNVSVKTGQGLATNTETNTLDVQVGDNLSVNSNNALQVNLGDGLTSSNNAVAVKISTEMTNAVRIANGAIYCDNVPIGTCIAFAGNVTPFGRGWLFCNGAAVSRTTYWQLWDTIGTIYGEGDGSTTFNIPDGNQRNIGSITTQVKQTSNYGLPNIEGTFGTFMGGAFYSSGALQLVNTSYDRDWSVIAGDFTRGVALNATWSSSIYGASNVIEMPTWYLRWYIKATY